ncbi:hypothetical protein GTO89_09370 [Heliobacterium gestii]|uniref:Uncharacterized protein n=1 Tax=Heliomicrobium gestii TaxID=2699 RepID=A0A845L928_HELGE|nr:hypothetical protein [Heliomicrobium gestii]MBM7867942.1 hypothetical protein [Heliomicrobium gestii]MZP43247.1 hypothetical protein [Heliomicrobium gestii]
MKVVYAGFGVWNSTNDATTAISKAYDKGQRTFLASNDWTGDPSPGNRKYLYIVWEQNGVTYSGVVGEGDSKGINLP